MFVIIKIFKGGDLMNKKLRIARINAELSQKELAKISGVSNDYISGLELGRQKNPGLDVVKRLCKALDKTVEELFFDEE